MTRRALVTGGAGFIGARLVHDLRAAGWSVCVLDDFSVGRAEDLAFAGGVVECVAADVADARAVAAIVAEWRPTVVFHLAALHFIPQCEREPVRVIQTNIVGTQRVIDALAERPGCRLVFASTADVYATCATPHSESSPLAPGTLYGITKLAGELLVGRAIAQGTTCRIARLFNVFGPGDRTPHVLPDIVHGLAQRGALDIGHLDPVRDYVYVNDVTRALMMLADFEGREYIFNVGSGKGRSVQDLVDAVLDVHGAPVAVRTDSAKLRPVDRPVLIADTYLARTVLGWSPTTTFRDGIERTLMAAAAPQPQRT